MSIEKNDAQKGTVKEQYLNGLKVWRKFIDESMEILGIEKETK